MRENLRNALPPAFRFWLKFHRARLLEKWRGRNREQGDPGEKQYTGIANQGLNVLVFDDHVPAPDRDAGSARMALILQSLAKLGRPAFISLGKFRPREYERMLEQDGVEIALWTEYQRLLKEQHFQVALLSRPDVAAALLPSIKRAAPDIKTIFDTVDLAFLRLEREYKLTGDKSLARKAAHYRRLEARLARSCDQVWCVTKEDQAALAREAPDARFAIIPTIHPLQDRGKSFAERDGVLFIGNFLHRPNTDAVHYFMQEIYPLVRARLPGLKLFIVGDQTPPEIVAYASTDVAIAGYVEDIDPIFQSCRAFIAPLRFGAGMKGKVGQALSYGLPVVTTSIGAEGFGLTHGTNAMISDDPESFANSVVELHTNSSLWQKIADNSHSHVAKTFTPEVLSRTITDTIRKLSDK